MTRFLKRASRHPASFWLPAFAPRRRGPRMRPISAFNRPIRPARPDRPDQPAPGGRRPRLPRIGVLASCTMRKTWRPGATAMPASPARRSPPPRPAASYCRPRRWCRFSPSTGWAPRRIIKVQAICRFRARPPTARNGSAPARSSRSRPASPARRPALSASPLRQAAGHTLRAAPVPGLSVLPQPKIRRPTRLAGSAAERRPDHGAAASAAAAPATRRTRTRTATCPAATCRCPLSPHLRPPRRKTRAARAATSTACSTRHRAGMAARSPEHDRLRTDKGRKKGFFL